jgi:hypothetical protein
MDQQYKNALKVAESLEFKIKDYLDDKSHNTAQTLTEEARQLVDDLEVKKNPRSVEGRVKSIMQTLKSVRGFASVVMDPDHAEHLYREYEKLMMSLRKFDNY